MISFGNTQPAPVTDAGSAFRKTVWQGILGTIVFGTALGLTVTLSVKARHLGLEAPCLRASVVTIASLLMLLTMGAFSNIAILKHFERGYLLIVAGLALGTFCHIVEVWPTTGIDMAFILIHWADVAALIFLGLMYWCCCKWQTT